MTYGGVWRSLRVLGVWGAALVTLGSLVPGCKGQSTESDDDSGGTSGTSGAPSGTPVDSKGFAQKFAASFCSSIGPCCMRGGYAYTEASCTQAATSYLDAAIAESLRYPGISFDERAAGDCIALYSAAAKACTDSTLVESGGQQNPCRNIFKGTVPEGGHCSEDAECADVEGVYIECDAGVCSRMPDDHFTTSDVHAKLGEACNASCSHANGGTSCSYTVTAPTTDNACWEEDGLSCTSQGVCAPVPKLGESCPDYVCVTDAHCDAASRRCVASTATGPCPTYVECLHTSYCDDSTQMCIPLKANGTPCNYDSECASESCEGDVCREWSIAGAGTCSGLLDD